jgi:hypothetical protein
MDRFVLGLKIMRGTRNPHLSCPLVLKQFSTLNFKAVLTWYKVVRSDAEFLTGQRLFWPIVSKKLPNKSSPKPSSETDWMSYKT